MPVAISSCQKIIVQMGKKEKSIGKKRSLKTEEAPAAPALFPGKLVQAFGTPQAFYTFLILLVIGTFMRFYQLGFNSLWLDEAATYTFSIPGFTEIWEIARTIDFHPPLFHWVEHIMLMFGNSEFILRFVPAVAGIATIPVFYLLGKELGNEKTGLISAALVTFSPFQLYYSQEAYSYSLVLFTFSIALLMFVKAIRTNDRNFWVIFGGVAALSVWIHYYTLIPISLLYLFGIIKYLNPVEERITRFRNLGFAFITNLILVLPLVPLVFERFSTLSAKPPTYGVLGPALISDSIYRFFGFNWILVFVLLVLFAGGLYVFYQKDRNIFFLFILIAVAPLIISVLLSAKITMNPRYLIYLLPVYYSGVAMAYAFIDQKSRKFWPVCTVILAICLVNVPFFVNYYSTYQKEDWRGVSQYLYETASPGDSIILVPEYLRMPLNYYYTNKSAGTLEFGANTVTDIEAILDKRGDQHIFFVVTGDILAADTTGDTISWLNSNTDLLRQDGGIIVTSLK